VLNFFSPMSRGASHARITAFSFLRSTDNGHTDPAIIPEANIPGLAPVLCLGRADVVQGTAQEATSMACLLLDSRHRMPRYKREMERLKHDAQKSTHR
jgi:hypothetical protein